MKKSLILSAAFAAMQLLAAPATDSPLWKTWADTPMIREWKELMAKEAWKDNKIGVDHDVPPPWTPMTVKDGVIGVWGRTYVFDGKALPVQLTSKGEKILAAPICFRALIDGKWYDSTPGTGKVVEQYPDRVVYAGVLEVAGVKIDAKTAIEFDGFAWMEFRIGARPEKLERLTLDFPIRKDVAQLYRKQSQGFTPKAVRERWGKVDGNCAMGPLVPGWATDFCLHNDNVGIDFISESLAGWLAKDFSRRAEWLVENGKVTARFNFIDAPPEGKLGETDIAVGFNMMPFRPLDRKAMARFTYSWNASGDFYKEIVELPAPVLRQVWPYYWALDEADKRKHFDDNCLPAAIPVPRSPENFIRFLEKSRKDKPGTKIVCYTVGDLHPDYDPVFLDQRAKWRGGTDDLDPDTVYAELRKKRGSIRTVCGHDKDYRDYKVFCLTYWAEKLGLDGYYWDDQSFTPCLNPDHKAHRFLDCNGKRMRVKPILLFRDMIKRVYKTVKKKNPDAVFVGHEIPPYVPFCEMVIDGEVLHRLAGKRQYYTRFVKPEDCRSVLFSSHVDGAAKSLLPEYRGEWASSRPEAVQATRAMMTMLWMTDMNIMVALCHGREVHRRFIAPRGSFGVHEAEYIPYYRHKLATVEVPDVYCTIFRKKDKVLVAVSNYGQKPVKDVLNLNLTEMFEGVSTGTLYNLKAYDGETHAPVKLTIAPVVTTCLAEIDIDIPGEDFRVFEIK